MTSDGNIRDALMDEVPDNLQKKSLSSLEKAVILLRFLNPDEIKLILKYFDRIEIERISSQMSRLESIKKSDLIRVLNEFRLESSGILSLDVPQDRANFFISEYEQIQNQGLPHKQLKGRLSNIHSLEKFSPEKIIDFFKNDHPQTMAITLSQISPSVAKEVLLLMESRNRNDILKRISYLKNVDSKVLQDINDCLDSKMTDVEDTEMYNGPESAANILSLFPEEEVKPFLSEIQNTSGDLFDKISKYYVTFTDILTLSPDVLQKILSTVEPQVIATAICKLDKEVIDKCFAVITKRATTLIQDEFTSLENIHPTLIINAQQAIVKNAKLLEQEKKIDLGKK